MDAVSQDIQVETLQEPPKPESQPPALEVPQAEVNPLKDLAPPMDDAQVRAAIAAAEAKGLDPLALKMSDLEVKKEPAQTEALPETGEKSTVEVPEKFRKPNGEADVEKIKASTKQLDEETEKRKAVNQKTVDDYMSEYNAAYRKFRETPNPEKLAASLPAPAAPPAPAPLLSDEELEEKILADLNKRPVKTIADLIHIMVEKKLEPINGDLEKTREERRLSEIRDNIKALAQRDPRVMQAEVFEAIKAKLRDDPDLWNRKNPHRAAWLEVKEELRLGDLPSGGPAQSSRPAAPILGGGTPPSSPSATGMRPTLASLERLDPKDKKQEALGDALIRSLLGR